MSWYKCRSIPSYLRRWHGLPGITRRTQTSPTLHLEKITTWTGTMSTGQPTSSQGLPLGFTFGFATVVYQIEGGVNEGGRGTCMWDTFTHLEPSRRSGGTGDVVWGHYHRYDENLDLLAKFDAKSYRFQWHGHVLFLLVDVVTMSMRRVSPSIASSMTGLSPGASHLG